jgi:hypothetical protein
VDDVLVIRPVDGHDLDEAAHLLAREHSAARNAQPLIPSSQLLKIGVFSRESRFLNSGIELFGVGSDARICTINPSTWSDDDIDLLSSIPTNIREISFFGTNSSISISG